MSEGELTQCTHGDSKLAFSVVNLLLTFFCREFAVAHLVMMQASEWNSCIMSCESAEGGFKNSSILLTSFGRLPSEVGKPSFV